MVITESLISRVAIVQRSFGIQTSLSLGGEILPGAFFASPIYSVVRDGVEIQKFTDREKAYEFLFRAMARAVLEEINLG